MFSRILAILIVVAVGVVSALPAAPTFVSFRYFMKGTNCSVPTGTVSSHELGACENQNMYTLQANNQVWNQLYTPSSTNCGIYSGKNSPFYIDQCQSGYNANSEDDIFVTVV